MTNCARSTGISASAVPLRKADDTFHHVVDTGDFPVPSIGADARVAVDFESIRDAVPPLVVTIDDQLRAQRGTGFDGVAALLGVALDWPTGAAGIAAVDPDDLVGATIAWSRLAEPEVRAVLDTLFLPGDQLQDAGQGSSLEVEGRAHRLALRPLPIVDSKVLILPWQLKASQQVYVVYLAQSRLPYPAASLRKPTTDTITRQRDQPKGQGRPSDRSDRPSIAPAEISRYAVSDALVAKGAKG
ncbi:hypothetical protein B5D80_27995 [Micromonospora wenchangensis]|uniref:Uncharacterized protein n=1 Tax=Micromonospora wenchangensis TaxID=1185415 RepID=A0A246REJ9_9ACTN|nr:hypothetical protein B5D80_27995 [Micromonospora wenchangensis]